MTELNFLLSGNTPVYLSIGVSKDILVASQFGKL